MKWASRSRPVACTSLHSPIVCGLSLQSKATPDSRAYLLSYLHGTFCGILVSMHSWIASGYPERTEVGQLWLQRIQSRQETGAGIKQHDEVMNFLKRDVLLL